MIFINAKQHSYNGQKGIHRLSKAINESRVLPSGVWTRHAIGWLGDIMKLIWRDKMGWIKNWYELTRPITKVMKDCLLIVIVLYVMAKEGTILPNYITLGFVFCMLMHSFGDAIIFIVKTLKDSFNALRKSTKQRDNFKE